MPLEDCRIIELPKIPDVRGNLTFIENSRHIPFDMKRIYYLYDVPSGSYRGAHAHKNLHQLIIAMSGSFDIVFYDGERRCLYHIVSSYYSLYVCPMLWRFLDNFSIGAICLVLASALYDEEDYIRDHGIFLDAVEQAKK